MAVTFLTCRSSIAKTTALVQRVAAASEEQSKGLQLVNQAMGDVDQATQRNAAAAQELAATASEMASQAESLQLALSRFRVNLGERAPEPAGSGKPNGNGERAQLSATEVLVGKRG